MLSVRYWYYKEECGGCRSSIQLPASNYFFGEDQHFNELFDKRSKLEQYLKEEFADKSLLKKLDLEAIINDIKNDPALCNKMIRPYESKNFYYVYKKQDAYDQAFDNEPEIIRRINESYNRGDIKFIDHLLFVNIEKISTLEDFTFKAIFNILMNMYAEKNANDLMLNIQNENNKNKSKKRKGKAGAIKKKTNEAMSFSYKESASILQIKSNSFYTADSCDAEDDSVLPKKSIEEKCNFRDSEYSYNSNQRLHIVDSDFSVKRKIRTPENNASYVVNLVNNIMNNVILTYNPYQEEKAMIFESADSKDIENPETSDTKESPGQSNNNEFEEKESQILEPPLEQKYEEDLKEKRLSNDSEEYLTPSSLPKHQTNKANKKKEGKPSFFLYPPKLEQKKGKKNKTKVNASGTCVINGRKENEKSANLDDKIKIENAGNHEILNKERDNSGVCMVDSYSQTQTSELNIESITSFEHRRTNKQQPLNISIAKNSNASIQLHPATTTNKAITSSINKSSKPDHAGGYSSQNLGRHTDLNIHKGNMKPQSEPLLGGVPHFHDNLKYKDSSSMQTCINPSEDVLDEGAINKSNKKKNSIGSKGCIVNNQNKYNINSQSSFTVNRAVEPNRIYNRFDKGIIPIGTNSFHCKPVTITSSSGLNINKASSFEISNPQNNYFIYNTNVNFNSNLFINHHHSQNHNNYYSSSDSFKQGTSPLNSQNLWIRKMSGDNLSILKKLNFEEFSPCTFSHKLHNDILDYSERVKYTLERLKPIKDLVIKVVNASLRLSIEADFLTEIYGSFATDLSIETSDVDILIRLSSEEFETELIINKICLFLTSLNLIECITPIVTATIPVIKLVVDPIKMINMTLLVKHLEIKELAEKYANLRDEFEAFLNSDNAKQYLFEFSQLSKIKIDLSFFSINQPSDLTVIHYIKNQVKNYPEITPLIQVLKRYLSLSKLNSSFNGGLSSHSLLLMIIAYARYPKTNTALNLGAMLVGFLEFYGKYFNFSQFVIDVANFK